MATALNSTAIYLSWDPVLVHEQNGIIQYYIVTVYEVSTDTSTEVDVVTTNISITDLHPYYEYQFSVAAYTVGPGPDTHISAITNQDGK